MLLVTQLKTNKKILNNLRIIDTNINIIHNYPYRWEKKLSNESLIACFFGLYQFQMKIVLEAYIVYETVLPILLLLLLWIKDIFLFLVNIILLYILFKQEHPHPLFISFLTISSVISVFSY